MFLKDSQLQTRLTIIAYASEYAPLAFHFRISNLLGFNVATCIFYHTHPSWLTTVEEFKVVFTGAKILLHK